MSDAESPRINLIVAALLTVALGSAALMTRTAWHRIEASSRAPEPPGTLLEAVGSGEVSLTHLFLSRGADPNGAASFTERKMTGGRAQIVTPLLVAAARRDENMIRMLLSFGARLDLPQNRLAGCLAHLRGANALARDLLGFEDEQASACPQPDPTKPLLSERMTLAVASP